MKFSQIEIRDLLFAGLIISLAFGILLAGGLKGLTSGGLFLTIFVIAFLTAGIGFLLHELMHKYVAQKYGLMAEFRAFYPMLGLALLFSFFGFIIAAPGAVFIYGMVNKERNGKISVAGPWTNIVLALIFLAFALVLPNATGALNYLLTYGLYINAFLALFNMIPAMPFDGAKVLAWNKVVYGVTVAVALGLVILSYIV
ncbi:MAG: hypothetical protein Q8Q31_00220 [Nanoarchaeota archaeon]|nr:hypothetical protein [Nanoarchaeota archaeon]